MIKTSPCLRADLTAGTDRPKRLLNSAREINSSLRTAPIVALAGIGRHLPLLANPRPQIGLKNPQFIARIRDRGEYLAGKLRALTEKHAFLGEIRGRGLLVGVEVLQERLAGKSDPAGVMPALLNAFREEGLLILRSGTNILRIAPPLIIEPGEIDKGIEIMSRVLETIDSGGLKLLD